MSAINVLHKPSEAELERCVENGVPVHITGAFDDWAALDNWHGETLKGPPAVQAMHVPYFTASKAGGALHMHDETMPFAELIDAVWAAQEPIVYMRQMQLKSFPHLMDGVVVPSFYKRPLVDTNLWIGQAGSVSALHFDFLDNLLCQVMGQKRLTIYAPGQTAALYPAFACGSESDFTVPAINFSLIDDNAERFPDAFPLANSARPVAEIDIGPGDMLYIPPYWWHRVATTSGPSVSVNFWYAAQYGKAYTAQENAQEIAFLNTLGELKNAASPHKRKAWRDFLGALDPT